ncbi:hypothetical protein ACLOJK_016832 [Asimina triloba]
MTAGGICRYSCDVIKGAVGEIGAGGAPRLTPVESGQTGTRGHLLGNWESMQIYLIPSVATKSLVPSLFVLDIGAGLARRYQYNTPEKNRKREFKSAEFDFPVYSPSQDLPASTTRYCRTIPRSSHQLRPIFPSTLPDSNPIHLRQFPTDALLEKSLEAMDDFSGLLARDFGLRSQGKSTPMAGPANAGIGSRGSAPRSGGWHSTPTGGSLINDRDDIFGTGGARNESPQDYGGYDSVFGGPSRGAPPRSSSPVFDKPVYDDDIFDGVPGLKSSGGSVKYDDVFSSMSARPTHADEYDDLLGGFSRSEPETKASSSKRGGDWEPGVSGFDDLIPGFGASSPPSKREASKTNHKQSTVPSTKSTSSVLDDPFVVLESTSVPPYPSSGLFGDPLDNINKPGNTDSRKADGFSGGGAVFDDIDAFKDLSINSKRKDKSPLREGLNVSPSHATTTREATDHPSKSFENIGQKKASGDGYQESHQVLFDMPTGLSHVYRSTGRSSFRAYNASTTAYETNQRGDMSPTSDEIAEMGDDVWITVSDIPLFTQPTSAPPPSRPPPQLVTQPAQASKVDRVSVAGGNMRTKVNGTDSVNSSGISSIDELEEFAMGRPRNYADGRAEVFFSEEEIEPNSAAAAAASAAAMKEAMDRAEAKFRQAREVRERERDGKYVKSRESARQEGDEKSVQDAQEREYKDKQERLDREREQKEMEEKEREQKRFEKEREREREQREREMARQAVERATREARERAAAEARTKAERAAVEKVNAEARERAERAAVQRAAAEARERAAAEARGRAEKAAAEARERAAAERAAAEARERAAAEARQKVAEAREKAAAEARERAERATVERAAAEVRARAERAAVERANAEARERAAAAAREKQQKNDNDLDSFFGMGGRPSSAPKQRSTTAESAFDAQFQNKGGSEAARRTSSVSSSTIRKTSSATNIVDDLSSIFGGTIAFEVGDSHGEFQEVEGETEERRKARFERHQRTLERAAKALAEKNERDMQTQRDQAERHRISETLDVEIKRWAAGKEGNLRALLSTLQYVGEF